LYQVRPVYWMWSDSQPGDVAGKYIESVPPTVEPIMGGAFSPGIIGSAGGERLRIGSNPRKGQHDRAFRRSPVVARREIR
jgi:hypothetical protein